MLWPWAAGSDRSTRAGGSSRGLPEDVRVAVDARPAVFPQKTGIGYYTWHLLNHLPAVDPRTEYLAWYLNARGLVGGPRRLLADLPVTERWTPIPPRRALGGGCPGSIGPFSRPPGSSPSPRPPSETCSSCTGSKRTASPPFLTASTGTCSTPPHQRRSNGSGGGSGSPDRTSCRSVGSSRGRTFRTW